MPETLTILRTTSFTPILESMLGRALFIAFMIMHESNLHNDVMEIRSMKALKQSTMKTRCSVQSNL